MDEEVKKQAVADETKGVAEPTPAVDSAQGADLDALLSQYDEGTKPVSPPEPKVETPTNDIVATRLQKLEQRYLQEEVNKAGEEVFDGLEVSGRLREAWLDKMAREKPAIARAFINKDNDPASWKRLIPALRLEARKDFPSAMKVDPEATADRNAVAAAVRGASTKATAEPAPSLGKMSDAELRKYTMDNFGFA